MDIFESPSARGRGDFWAITSYWNPVAYRRKYANYRLFREHLKAPLVAIELAFEGDFELRREDADILVQLRGGDILWQKERLLNLALRALPRSCRNVAWVDCDVVFALPDWHERAARLLERAALVQLFSSVYRMPPDWTPEQQIPPDAELLHGSPYLIASGMPVATCLGTPASQISCGHGYAWATSRRLLDAHGLYDALVIGGADSAMARAAYGRFDDALRLQALHRDHYFGLGAALLQRRRFRTSLSSGATSSTFGMARRLIAAIARGTKNSCASSSTLSPTLPRIATGLGVGIRIGVKCMITCVTISWGDEKMDDP